jgi:hypothetical protein
MEAMNHRVMVQLVWMLQVQVINMVEVEVEVALMVMPIWRTLCLAQLAVVEAVTPLII